MLIFFTKRKEKKTSSPNQPTPPLNAKTTINNCNVGKKAHIESGTQGTCKTLPHSGYEHLWNYDNKILEMLFHKYKKLHNFGKAFL